MKILQQSQQEKRCVQVLLTMQHLHERQQTMVLNCARMSSVMILNHQILTFKF